MKLRLILSDQLNLNHSWFQAKSDDVMYVMMETRQELEFVCLHRQKQLGILANMREFSKQIRSQGHNIQYIYLDEPTNEQQLDWNLLHLLSEYHVSKFEFQQADEYSTHAMMQQFVSSLDIPYEEVSSEHFFTEKDELGKFFAGKKKFLMEHFYRHMRKRHQILVDGNDEPVGGKWNYDGQNRERFPDDMPVPEPFVFHHDLTAINKLLNKMDIKSMGHVNQKDFIWPVGRNESLVLLNHFIKYLLPQFGTYQDAMTTRGWTLFHSRVSFALNRKLVSPKEVVQAALDAYQRESSVTLPQVEGFIRQIIGWREYMRGVYWDQMPEYATKNHFFADRSLPSFYWTGKTDMNCLRHVITQSLDYGWAHHIQRLMIPGNFAMLIGADPDQVDDWFLGMYHDAVQWVEMPNGRGMSQFADGGIVGTKPYAVSANYINNMSDYCQSCNYDKDKKIGKDACPFNTLYWHFYHRNRKRLAWFPRLNQTFAIWDRMPEDRRTAYLEQAEHFLTRLK